ncbi:molybdate ABC transporter substrate-binding protein [Nakamurella sp. YIM 132087]|uniref:Molybdate ABC transporter substrate-binding protein n=1 Tax=Nakamurella alba TaxID=2665158 RepID=A0A7K1FS78_9ACTN|nr:molybdate ABC transporter substrate-binding protein [Nakamurella alba]MTD16995.1 molybdate ABC transporter substrate-binding protein [Nakamurella alba]
MIPSSLRRRAAGGLAVALAVAMVAGCGSSSDSASSTTPPTTAPPTTSAPTTSAATGASDMTSASSASEMTSASEATSAAPDDLSGTLTVYAAASLKKTFDQLRTDFMAAHPDVEFAEITYDGSSTLATQLINGAQADVFASADLNNMKKVTDESLIVGDPVNFATNTLQIAVAPGNPKGITDLASLAAADLKVVLCAPEVPCGNAAQKALDAAGVSVTAVSEEQNVTAVLTKVETGDADAGLVYKTDVAGSDGGVDGVDFPEAADAVNEYPIGVLTAAEDAGNTAAASAFVSMVTGAEGQQVLADAGFGAP